MIAFRGLTRLPINCRACPCHNELYDECNAIRMVDYEANNDCSAGKPDACPLIELREPPEISATDGFTEIEDCTVRVTYDYDSGVSQVQWKRGRFDEQ